ncbi:carboxypeptidase C PRC1 [Sugiyamaella lignohabitans]|uniref:carboxypeptidase C n=1 Tax=Sugiyamaella lignohabitans TaxID=796027 RepID=A0A170QYM5_9ASCO|nr:carboxypeptidase C PRC1 [Sugiyamaella lignohabitans]ANB15985.1 carboxypeptidase C PRC1 [Sugiyamaella lignohabitans]
MILASFLFATFFHLTCVLARVTFHDTSSLGWDPTIVQFAGYIDVDEGHNSLFYWFFESRNEPANDPVILFLNGGPGCSSMKALWLNFPGVIQANLSHTYNPYSWNANASILYLDNPAGTGLSTVGRDVNNTADMSRQVYEFLNIFFDSFPAYRELEVHVVALSDAGYYAPDIAVEILSHDEKLFNLASIAIGNGLVNAQLQYQYIQPMVCGAGGISPVLSPETCADMDLDTPLCVEQISDCNTQGYGCSEALDFCNQVTFNKIGNNLFNLEQPCDNITSECYPGDTYYVQYMNLPVVMTTVGSKKTNFTACNATIAQDFADSGSQLTVSSRNLTTILEEGVPVLIFSGDLDGTYNWLGTRAVSKTLKWSGHDEFISSNATDLELDKTVIGQATNYENLSFVRIFQAGHLTSYDKPKETLKILNTWMAGDYSFKSLRSQAYITLR